ncbi:hypothetical protein SynPROS91_01112 [Synechococcus sp. PROS-9-1]|nr:hypothetical protein SynPROS91_01112 [Synechococcus sp. PROS-9-1]
MALNACHPDATHAQEALQPELATRPLASAPEQLFSTVPINARGEHDWNKDR